MNDSVARLFDDAALGYEQNIIPFVGRLAEAFTAAIPADRVKGRILDVGTGTGIVVRCLAPRADQVIGIDIAPQMIKIARAVTTSANSAYALADIHAPPFTDGSFDAIIGSFGFNTTHPRGALRQAARLIKPGGWLIIQEWAVRDVATACIESVIDAHIPDDVITQVASQFDMSTDWEDHLQDVEDYYEMLGAAGFGAIEASESAPTAVQSASIEPFIRYQLAWPTRQAMLHALDNAPRDAFYAALRDQLAPLAAPNGVFSWQPTLFRVAAQRL